MSSSNDDLKLVGRLQHLNFNHQYSITHADTAEAERICHDLRGIVRTFPHLKPPGYQNKRAVLSRYVEIALHIPLVFSSQTVLSSHTDYLKCRSVGWNDEIQYDRLKKELLQYNKRTNSRIHDYYALLLCDYMNRGKPVTEIPKYISMGDCHRRIGIIHFDALPKMFRRQPHGEVAPWRQTKDLYQEPCIRRLELTKRQISQAFGEIEIILLPLVRSCTGMMVQDDSWTRDVDNDDWKGRALQSDHAGMSLTWPSSFQVILGCSILIFKPSIVGDLATQ